jgi:hypothetical protein
MHVEQDDIRLAGCDARDRRLDIRCFADYIDLVAELSPDARAKQVVIIDDEDSRPSRLLRTPGGAQVRLRWRSRAVLGIVNDTSVPSPLTVRTVA